MNHIQTNLTQQREEFISLNNSEFNVHDHLKGRTVPELREISQGRTFPFYVMCLNVIGDLNTGTVIRSSHLFGAERVVIFGRRRIDNRGMVGAANYTTVDRVWAVGEDMEINHNTFKDYCLENRVAPIFVEQGGVNVFKFNWKCHIAPILGRGSRPMLVLGTENSGIPESILALGPELGSATVSIPQRGVIRSHNVSMAFATVTSQLVGAMSWY